MLNPTSRELVGRMKLLTAPAAEPVTFADFQARTHCSGQDETFAEGLITTARQLAEEWCGRAFITQTWQLWFDIGCGAGDQDDFWYTDSPQAKHWRFMPAVIELPRPPLISVSSIKYYLDDGVEAATTFASTNYQTSTTGELGRVRLKTGKTWPTGLRAMDSLVIEYTAGYTTGGEAPTANVPQAIKDAIIEWAAHMYENREGQQAANAGGAVVLNRGAFVPAGVQTKLMPYRVIRL
jgi:uncharacterized phiE125 gp8 family phage protein